MRFDSVIHFLWDWSQASCRTTAQREASRQRCDQLGYPSCIARCTLGKARPVDPGEGPIVAVPPVQCGQRRGTGRKARGLERCGCQDERCGEADEKRWKRHFAERGFPVTSFTRQGEARPQRETHKAEHGRHRVSSGKTVESSSSRLWTQPHQRGSCAQVPVARIVDEHARRL